jgi:hypothetical protein
MRQISHFIFFQIQTGPSELERVEALRLRNGSVRGGRVRSRTGDQVLN